MNFDTLDQILRLGMKLIVVIADYNRHDDTLACLASLKRCDDDLWHVIVVDSGSEQPFLLPASSPNIEVFRLPVNGGFAVAFNFGIRHALSMGATAILVLNNDTLVAPDFLAPLLAVRASGAAIVAPRIYYASDPQRIWAEGFSAHRWTLEMRDSLRGCLEDDAPHTPQVVDYVTGCAMLIDRKVFEVIGFFDERFFAYYEDLDFCIRASRAGFHIMTAPASHVWHKVASTTGLGTSRRQYLMVRSSVLFFAKHAGRRWPIVLAYRAGSMLKTLAVSTWKRRPDLIQAYIEGLKEGWRDAQKPDER